LTQITLWALRPRFLPLRPLRPLRETAFSRKVAKLAKESQRRKDGSCQKFSNAAFGFNFSLRLESGEFEEVI